MVLICPYCDIELNEKMIEQEDGCCPECGAVITASTVISEDEDYDDEFEDEYGDDLDDDGDGYDSMDDFDDFDDEPSEDSDDETEEIYGDDDEE